MELEIECTYSINGKTIEVDKCKPSNYYTVTYDDADSLDIEVYYKGKKVCNAVSVTFRGFPLESFNTKKKINWKERLSE